jgi:hypothetical protein
VCASCAEVVAQRPAYALCGSKAEKNAFAENLVQQMQKQGCRFLEMAGEASRTANVSSPVVSPHGMVWVETSFARALEKTAMALRDSKWTMDTSICNSDDSSQPSNSDNTSIAPTEEPGTLLFNSSNNRKKPAATTKQSMRPAALVNLPYRPDDAAVRDYPLIALPRANDVIFGRGCNVAHHQQVVPSQAKRVRT